MPVELIKEYVKLNRVILMTESQSIFESDILVPDIKPDIAEILVVDAVASVDSVENYKDKLSIDVNVLYKILYKCNDELMPVRSINYTATYNTSVNVDNLTNDSISTVKCDVEHVDYNLLNDRKINCKVILKFGIQVVNIDEKGLACDVESDSSIQMKNKAYNISSCIYQANEEIDIFETLTLPGVKSSINEILRTDAVILGKSVRFVDDQLIVKGELNITTLFIAEDERNSLQYVENTIPFSRTLLIDGVDLDTMLETDIYLKSFSEAIAEDSDGENRCLDVEALIGVRISCYENKSVNILDDVYALDAKLDVKRENCNVLEYLGETQNQFVLKEIIQKPDDMPEISEIISITCTPGVTDWNISDNQVVIEGFVQNSILYLSTNQDNPVTCFTRELPYKHVFDMKDIYDAIDDEINVKVKADIEHINYSIISIEELELRIVINAQASLGKINQIPAIASINEEAFDKEAIKLRPSLVVYFVREGDTLWNVAKKYSTTEEMLIETNNLEDSTVLTPGQQLLVPKALFG